VPVFENHKNSIFINHLAAAPASHGLLESTQAAGKVHRFCTFFISSRKKSTKSKG
jgi:hypothetical protein